MESLGVTLQECRARALREAEDYLSEADPVRSNCEKICFMSHSKGRGRTRRQPKEILLVRYGRHCYTVKDIPTGGLDVVAKELLNGRLPPGKDEYQEFLRRFLEMEPE